MGKRLNKWLLRVYAIGYRFIDKNECLMNNTNKKFKLIMPSKKYGYADPFVVHKDDKHYIFVEIMDKYTERGSIGVCCVEDGCKVQEIIKEDFHMSYPNVFVWNNKYYMIPETYQAKELRLYVAEEFPYKWKFEATLISGLELVDFSFITDNEYLIGIAQDIENKRYKNRYFKINMNTFSGQEIFPDAEDAIDKRPGGNFFEHKGSMYLPMQECNKCYGEFLHVVQSQTLSEDKVVHVERKQIKANQISVNKLIAYDRIHTYNRSDDMEVIDIFLYKVSLKKVIKELIRGE